MKSIRLQTLLILAFTAIQAAGQQSPRQFAEEDHGWFMYLGNHKLSDRLSLHTEYQWRRNDWILSWQQSLARIGIDYKLKENAVITAGYAHVFTFPYGEFPVAHSFGEHRIWEQFAHSSRVGRLHLHHRFRLEQRWSDHLVQQGTDGFIRDGAVYTNRIRYRFQVTIPINRPQLEKGVFLLNLSDEPFISFGRHVAFNVFDQNRLAAAVGYQFSASGNIQAGYLNQLLFKPDGVRVENNHTLSISLTYNLDLSRNGSAQDKPAHR